MDSSQFKRVAVHILLFIARVCALIALTIWQACISLYQGVCHIWQQTGENPVEITKETECTCWSNSMYLPKGRVIDIDNMHPHRLDRKETPQSRQDALYCDKHFPKEKDADIIPLESKVVDDPIENDTHGETLGRWPMPDKDWKAMLSAQEIKRVAEGKEKPTKFASLSTLSKTSLAPLNGSYSCQPSRFTADLDTAPIAAVKVS